MAYQYLRLQVIPSITIYKLFLNSRNYFTLKPIVCFYFIFSQFLFDWQINAF